MQLLEHYTLPAYRLLTWCAAPLIVVYLYIRLAQGKEDRQRLHERFGYASADRKTGKLFWLHAASVGEALSLLRLLDRLHQLQPEAQLLITSGTVTSARILAEKLPPYVIHQFSPVDTPQAVGRFLNHWQPSLAVFTESELWPNMILKTRGSGAQLALINARMSEKSFLYWKRQPWMIGQMLRAFAWIAAQTSVDAARYKSLGATTVMELGNLKYDAEPLACDEALLAPLKAALGHRPCVVAASLHPGEDASLVNAHVTLRKMFPDLLTILVPRHPHRGASMFETAKAVGVKVARRSIGDFPNAQTEIYIADTMAELGVWYRLATLVVIGGSFITHGGQNLLEPIRLHAPVVVGPHMFNFAEMLKSLLRMEAVIQVVNEKDLAPVLQRLLDEKAVRDKLISRADTWLAATAPVAEVVANKLIALVGANENA